MGDQRKFAFIFNPYAGRGNARKMEDRLLRYLAMKGIAFSFHRTREPLHATQIAREVSRDHDVLVAVGGDGTVHEVASGMNGSTAALAVVPVGSGNDFSRLVGMPKRLEDAVDSIVGGVRRVFDTGVLTFQDATADTEIQGQFVNSLGIGLDAVVADQVRRITWLRGLPLYLAAVANTLRHLESYDLQIEADGWSERKKAFVVCVGNGMCEGGGFRLTPDADPHDQKFQVCIIEEMSAFKAIPVVPRLVRGTHGGHPNVILRDATRIEVRSAKPFVMHADGEILGRAVTRVTAEVRAGAVGVIVPA